MARIDDSVKGVDVSSITCPRCQTEYDIVRTPNGRTLPERCPACNPPSAPDEGETKAAPALSFDVLDALNEAGVNVHKYQGATIDSLDGETMEAERGFANEYIAMYRAAKGKYPARDWAYLFGAGSAKGRIGQTGNGKTHIAIAIGRRLVELGALDRKKFRFVTAERLLLQTEATFKDATADSEDRLIARYSALDLLIVDDIGVRDALSAHAVRVLDELAKEREQKATIWTSNKSVPVLIAEGDGMKRIGSRMAGECGANSRFIVEFEGPDRRIARSRKAA